MEGLELVDVVVFGLAADLCMNFMVRSREDIIFGSFGGAMAVIRRTIEASARLVEYFHALLCRNISQA